MWVRAIRYSGCRRRVTGLKPFRLLTCSSKQRERSCREQLQSWIPKHRRVKKNWQKSLLLRPDKKPAPGSCANPPALWPGSCKRIEVSPLSYAICAMGPWAKRLWLRLRLGLWRWRRWGRLGRSRARLGSAFGNNERQTGSLSPGQWPQTARSTCCTVPFCSAVHVGV